MILYKKAEDLHKYIVAQKNKGKSIGYVPTMGALHQGHVSLIELAKQSCDLTVCSIFVNPTQFNDFRDFEKYPITTSSDLQLLAEIKCDVIFLPSIEEIYPNSTKDVRHYSLGEVENLFEGKYRPGHFQGVCQVVDKLLSIVVPHKIFIGQKDYQQCIVIQQLINLLQLSTQVIIGPTLRESSGLAMSSRNSRLSEADKQNATAISKTLNYIKDNCKQQPIQKLEQSAYSYLLSHGFTKVDYIAIVNARTLQPVTDKNLTVPKVVLIAAFINDVRLIDNMLIEP